MKANPSGPEGLALQGPSAALRGLAVDQPRPAPRALHPPPCRANAAHAEYSDRLLLDHSRYDVQTRRHRRCVALVLLVMVALRHSIGAQTLMLAVERVRHG